MNTADCPLVSIIMPAYNAEKYISEAIESVINQTYSNWELLITDDGSTDKTSDIIKSFNDKRIYLTSQKNEGVSVARNKGLSLAKGKYITFLDADDMLTVNSLELRVKYLEYYLEIDLVDGKIFVNDKYMQNTIKLYNPYYTGNFFSRLIALDSRVFFNVYYMFRKEILGDIRFTEKMTHAEDLLFYIELSNKNLINYGFVSEVIYLYRSGHTSAMSNLTGLESGYILLIKKLKNFNKVSFFQHIYIRYRFIRVMFLSWLKQKEILKAFKSVIKLILT